jgi:hypothetical protein
MSAVAGKPKLISPAPTSNTGKIVIACLSTVSVELEPEAGFPKRVTTRYHVTPPTPDCALLNLGIMDSRDSQPASVDS